jgi:hypothetical protein
VQSRIGLTPCQARKDAVLDSLGGEDKVFYTNGDDARTPSDSTYHGNRSFSVFDVDGLEGRSESV